MPKRIILNADEIITCPDCGHEFALRDGITQQTIERYADAYDAALAEERDKLRAAAEKEAARQAARTFEQRIGELTEKLAESQASGERLKGEIARAREKAAGEARAEAEARLQEIQQTLAERDRKIDAYREQEIKLRQQQRELEDARKEFELNLQRKLDEEKNKLQQQMAESYNLREAEYRKRIEDAHKANEELRRKLEQGSQQLQGEVLELELESLLTTAFPLDQVEEVKKGVRGADVIQTVVTRSGNLCGKLVWESKRAENWSNNWIAKLKDDQQAANAELAVLVTTAFPVDTPEPFIYHEDVWVVRPFAIRPVAEALRMTLLEKHKQRVVNEGRNEKVEALYDYLCSPQFAQKIRGVIDAYSAMKTDLDKERAAMERLWKKREMQLQRITTNMLGLSGELQGIAENALPHLDEIAALPDESET